MNEKMRQTLDTMLFKYRHWIMLAVLMVFIIGIAYIFLGMNLAPYEKRILGIVFVIAIASSGFSSVLGRISHRVPESDDVWLNRDATNWLADWLSGISTEMIGALITTVLLGLFLDQLQVKDNLLEQIHSQLEQNAVQALENMRVNEWLTDGTLQGENLIGVIWIDADLRNADLREVNMQDVTLSGTNLSDSFLQRANLQNGNLSNATLTGAMFEEANLSQANLSGIIALDCNFREVNFFWAIVTNANLSRSDLTGSILLATDLQNTLAEEVIFRDADLTGALLQDTNLLLADLANANLERVNLQGAYLLDANLEGASLEGAVLDTTTVLPDGTNWTSTTDMEQFTDPEHVNFWRSDNADSPAWGIDR